MAPQTLEVRAWAEDYLPGRTRSHSASFVLHVLNKTDHALWLTEQFGKWLEVAQESYEREQQLHQSNKELRALSAEELDRPENRRRVAQQANAENAKAARLDGLTNAGKSLVEQATKNDEFDAKRLESWATMLKSLKDIAANRMPSVSDLLKQTAGAPRRQMREAGGKPIQRSARRRRNPDGAQAGEQAAAQTPKPPTGENPQSEQARAIAKSAPSLAQGEQPPSAPKPPSDRSECRAEAAGAEHCAIATAVLAAKPSRSRPIPNAAPKPPGARQAAACRATRSPPRPTRRRTTSRAAAARSRPRRANWTTR